MLSLSVSRISLEDSLAKYVNIQMYGSNCNKFVIFLGQLSKKLDHVFGTIMFC